jgi:hypothetical protein
VVVAAVGEVADPDAAGVVVVGEFVFGFGGKRLETLAELHSVHPTGQVRLAIHLMGTSVDN